MALNLLGSNPGRTDHSLPSPPHHLPAHVFYTRKAEGFVFMGAEGLVVTTEMR
jgi:hypothetical protein